MRGYKGGEREKQRELGVLLNKLKLEVERVK